MADADRQDLEDRINEDLAKYLAYKKRDTGKLSLYEESEARRAHIAQEKDDAAREEEAE